MKAKNCLLYLLQLCRLEFLLETLEVNLTLLFKVTFYYSQPFHKLPHSWELEAQAGDNCKHLDQKKKSISLFHWRSDIRMTFVGKTETWISTSISDQTGTFAWIEFPSKVRIWFCISESTVLLLILNTTSNKKGIYTQDIIPYGVHFRCWQSVCISSVVSRETCYYKWTMNYGLSMRESLKDSRL